MHVTVYVCIVFKCMYCIYEYVEKEIKDMKAAGYLITGRNDGILTTSEAIQPRRHIP